jgi:hypothetical protein
MLIMTQEQYPDGYAMRAAVLLVPTAIPATRRKRAGWHSL